MLAFINGQWLEEHAAAIGISDLAIQRGYGVFDFFRTVAHTPFYIDDYMDRFYCSAEGLRLPVPYNRTELKDIIAELIRRNNHPRCGFRMILTGGYSADSYQPSSPNFIIIQQPLAMPADEVVNRGISIILHEHSRELAQIKSINYLSGIWLQPILKSSQADEVLYHKNGMVLEFPRSNVFIVTKDDTIVTPGENVLKGITRNKVLQLAAANYKVEERNILIDELQQAKEMFLTSTTKRLMPVVKVEGQPVGTGKPGAITIKLLKEFIQTEQTYCR